MGQYAQNAAAVFTLNYPLVACPKYRRPVLLAPLDRRLQALLQQKTAELRITIHRVEKRAIEHKAVSAISRFFMGFRGPQAPK